MKLSVFQLILLGTFVLGALIGLFVFATYTGKSKTNNTVGTVVIWGTLPESGIQATLTALSQADQSFKSVSYVKKDPATLPSDIAIAIATGASPDLILASQEELHPLEKFISPISTSVISANTFVSTFIDEGRIFMAPGGAGYYGLPFLVDPLVLYSNRSILSSNGVAQPPTTWEALTGLVPHFTVLTPSRQITRGLIALGAYNNVHNARGILSTLFLQQGISITSYSSSATLVSNLGQSSSNNSRGTSVLGFYTQFADPSKVSYTWNTSLSNSTQMFLSGDLTLYFGYASESRYLQSANPNLNFTVSPVPQSQTSTTKGVYGLLYAFMIPRGVKNANGAIQAATLMVGSANQAIAAGATGLVPANLNSLANPPAADPGAAVAYAEALYSQGWLSPAATDVDRVFSGMIGNVISGGSNLGEALGDASRSLGSLLQQ